MFKRFVRPFYTVFSTLDPAIDLEKSDLAKYQQTLDPKYLSFRPGETPAEFDLAPLTVIQLSQIQDYATSLPREKKTIDGKEVEIPTDSGFFSLMHLNLRYSIRAVRGVELNGEPLTLKMDPERKIVTQDSFDQFCAAIYDPVMLTSLGIAVGVISHGIPFQSGESTGQ